LHNKSTIHRILNAVVQVSGVIISAGYFDRQMYGNLPIIYICFQLFSKKKATHLFFNQNIEIYGVFLIGLPSVI